MDLKSIGEAIEAFPLSEWMRETIKGLPIIEAVHVMAIAVVIGTIFIVDLRLLGLPNTRRSFTRVSGDLLRWTWVAFAVAVLTGGLMFIANATTYLENIPFRFKMGVLALAGINMAVFQFITVRNVADWDKDVAPPTPARVAGIISLTCWVSIVFLGRWIGFTDLYDFEVPQDIDVDFDFLGGLVALPFSLLGR